MLLTDGQAPHIEQHPSALCYRCDQVEGQRGTPYLIKQHQQFLRSRRAD